MTARLSEYDPAASLDFPVYEDEEPKSAGGADADANKGVLCMLGEQLNALHFISERAEKWDKDFSALDHTSSDLAYYIALSSSGISLWHIVDDAQRAIKVTYALISFITSRNFDLEKLGQAACLNKAETLKSALRRLHYRFETCNTRPPEPSRAALLSALCCSE